MDSRYSSQHLVVIACPLLVSPLVTGPVILTVPTSTSFQMTASTLPAVVQGADKYPRVSQVFYSSSLRPLLLSKLAWHVKKQRPMDGAGLPANNGSFKGIYRMGPQPSPSCPELAAVASVTGESLVFGSPVVTPGPQSWVGRHQDDLLHHS